MALAAKSFTTLLIALALGAPMSTVPRAEASPQPIYSLWIMDRDGTDQREVVSSGFGSRTGFEWSPGGDRIAYSNGTDIFVATVDPWAPTNLGMPATATFGNESYPTWSPDGTRLSFMDGADVWVVNSDGTGRANVTAGPAHDRYPRWSPVGDQIAYLTSAEPWGPPTLHVVDFATGADKSLVRRRNGSKRAPCPQTTSSMNRLCGHRTARGSPSWG